MQQTLKQLNSQQAAAVKHEAGPAVVLAGAGSGKTRVLTTRAAWLIQKQEVDPGQILLVTFTNKAAHEMNQRLENLTGYQLPHSGTFHGFCAGMLRREGRLLGLSPNYLIYDTNDQRSLIKQLYKELGINNKKYKPRMAKSLISQAKNELITAQQYQRQAQQAHDDFKLTIARIYRAYQRRLKQHNAVDFDDLLLKTVKLLEQEKQLLSRYQQQLQHVLVDEYQDTNKAQYRLTQLLSQPQNNAYVVGDFSQSIYAWRGADYRNLFNLKQDFSQLTEYRLERNYRSTKPILAAASELIAHNTSHPVLDLWTEQDKGDKLTIIEAEDNRQEARAVVKEIKWLTQHAKPAYHYQDIAIFYRTNAQSRAFEEAFIAAGIPYQLIGGFKFYERKEIKDVLAYLRLVVNPQDAVSRERTLKLGKRRFKRFQKWLNKQGKQVEAPQQQQQQELESAAKQPPESGDTKESSDTTASSTAQNTETVTSPLELIKDILNATDYLDRYDRKDPDDVQRLENVKELMNIAAQFQDPIIFLENVSLVQDNQLKDVAREDSTGAEATNQAQRHQAQRQSRGQVSMMSLHSAKGLEFPVVFIVGMEEKLLPHSRCMFDAEQIEEERRLCYVGITRAKRKLYLSYANQRWLYGRSRQAKPSRFLQQIPDRLTVKRQSSPNLGQSNDWKKRKKAHKSNANQLNDRAFDPDSPELDALLKEEIDIDEFLAS